jgi:hypothetical protein
MKKSTSTQTITVKTNEENPEPLEIIAQSVIEVADAMKKISNSRLKQRAIILLIKDLTNLPMKDIESVLNTATKLREHYIKAAIK